MKQILLLLIAIAMLPAAVRPQASNDAGSSTPSDRNLAVRVQVLKFGVGQSVNVREQSGVKLKGTIAGIGPNAFQMEWRDASGPTYVYYADVAKVKRAHRRVVQFGKSSDKTWVASVGVAAVLALVVFCGDSGCH